MTVSPPRRSILITGCSSGIGQHAAFALKNRGWQVFATCRKETDCERLRADGLESFPLDYEDEPTITSALQEVLSRTGGTLEALFNNGAYAIPGAVEDLSTPALRQIFQANFFGWHELTRQVIPVMRAQGKGRIVQCSSVSGFVGMRFRGGYTATKFALEGLTDTLRLEIRGSNIDVILIEPGPIRTHIRANAWKNFRRWIQWQGSVHEITYEKKLIPRLSAENPAKDPFELMPDAVTAKLIQALESSRPRPRYRVTTATDIMAVSKRLLPTRALDWVCARL